MCAQILALLERPEDPDAISESLRQSGHLVILARNFAQAKALLIVSPFDLIISDVHLENGGSVFDFLMWVKRYPHTMETPFVLFSSRRSEMAKYLDDGIKITARALGAAKYIAMDCFDAKDFREQIDSLLPKKDESVEAELPQTTLQT
jgi:CheY-like chemotaxis protein